MKHLYIDFVFGADSWERDSKRNVWEVDMLYDMLYFVFYKCAIIIKRVDSVTSFWISTEKENFYGAIIWRTVGLLKIM